MIDLKALIRTWLTPEYSPVEETITRAKARIAQTIDRLEKENEARFDRFYNYKHLIEKYQKEVTALADDIHETAQVISQLKRSLVNTFK